MTAWRRSDRIGELCNLRFPAYTSDVRNFSLRAINRLKADPPFLEVVEAITDSFELDLKDLFHPTTSSEKLHDSTNAVAEWLEKVIEYEDQLEGLTNKELSELYHREFEKGKLKSAAAAAERDERHFFNEPNASADFKKWLRMPTWKAAEAVALSMGKNPTLVTIKTLEQVAFSPFKREFKHRIEILNRAIAAGDLKRAFKPVDFVNWIKANDIFDLPVELISLRSEPDWQKMYLQIIDDKAALCAKINELETLIALPTDTSQISPKRLTSIYKLIYGMAKKLEYPNHGAVQSITSATQKAGHAVDTRIVSDILKEAKNYVDEKSAT